MREFLNPNSIDFKKVYDELFNITLNTKHQHLREILFQRKPREILMLIYMMLMKKSYNYMKDVDLNDPKCLAKILSELIPPGSIETLKKKARKNDTNAQLMLSEYYMLNTNECLSEANMELVLDLEHPEIYSNDARILKGYIQKFFNLDEIPSYCKLTPAKINLEKMWQCIEKALDCGMYMFIFIKQFFYRFSTIWRTAALPNGKQALPYRSRALPYRSQDLPYRS